MFRREYLTRLIIGVVVVLVGAGFPTATVGEPDWELPTDPIANCIEDCATAYPELGEDYDACAEDCNGQGPVALTGNTVCLGPLLEALTQTSRRHSILGGRTGKLFFIVVAEEGASLENRATVFLDHVNARVFIAGGREYLILLGSNDALAFGTLQKARVPESSIRAGEAWGQGCAG